MRGTKRWEIRFWQTFLGINEVDCFKAYRRFCPGKETIRHVDFLRVLTMDLINNKIGCATDAPVLRRRADNPAGVQQVHILVPNKSSPYFVGKVAAARAAHKPVSSGAVYVAKTPALALMNYDSSMEVELSQL